MMTSCKNDFLKERETFGGKTLKKKNGDERFFKVRHRKKVVYGSLQFLARHYCFQKKKSKEVFDIFYFKLLNKYNTVL